VTAWGLGERKSGKAQCETDWKCEDPHVASPRRLQGLLNEGPSRGILLGHWGWGWRQVNRTLSKERRPTERPSLGPGAQPAGTQASHTLFMSSTVRMPDSQMVARRSLVLSVPAFDK